MRNAHLNCLKQLNSNVMISYLLVLLSGIISGFIIFQSAINAPLIFKTLHIDQARPFLRSVFPILFKTVAALGVVMVVLALLNDNHWITLAICVFTVILSTTCALLVPATNRASDAGDQQQFQRLHKISVMLTVAVLVNNLILPFTM